MSDSLRRLKLSDLDATLTSMTTAAHAHDGRSSTTRALAYVVILGGMAGCILLPHHVTEQLAAAGLNTAAATLDKPLTVTILNLGLATALLAALALLRAGACALRTMIHSWRRRRTTAAAARLLTQQRPDPEQRWYLHDWEWAYTQLGTPIALAQARTCRHLREPEPQTSNKILGGLVNFWNRRYGGAMSQTESRHDGQSPNFTNYADMTNQDKIRAAEIMYGTGSRQHQAAIKKFNR